MSTTAAQRQTIRLQLREQRAALDSERQASAAAAVMANLAGIELLQTAQTVAGYRAVRGEVDIDGVLSQLIETGTTVTVPRVAGDDLEFVNWLPDQRNKPGAFGIPEPVDAQILDLALHDVVLSPLVAFDRTGQRLGQGRGFYDRALARLGDKRPAVIGIAYTFQEVESIPTEPWDIPLDAVVTDSKVIEFRPEVLGRSISANRPQ